MPSGTLKALKGHVDAVAVVVLFCLAMGALVERVQPWPVVAGLALTLLVFAFLRRAEYRNKEKIADLKVQQAAIRAEEARVRYGALRASRQPSLELQPPQCIMRPSRPRPGEGNT